MSKPFQRKGAKSNTDVGNEFEDNVKLFFHNRNISLSKNFEIDIGINGKKPHRFDLGSRENKIIIECKSHTWTESSNVPSAKLTTWDQAMYYFFMSPTEYRKIFFVLKDWNPKKQETLAEYYIRTHYHLIPKSVEIWEMEKDLLNAKKIYPGRY